MPATRSPRRWERLDTNMLTKPRKPNVPHTSTRPSAPRAVAWVSLMGAPSSLTTRSFIIALPSVRPPQNASISTG